MKMPVVGKLSLVAGFDVPVEPLSGFLEWGNSMGFALPDSSHRDNQKDKSGQLEEGTAQAAVGDCADHTEDRVNNHNRDVKSKGLRRVKADLHFLAWDKEQFNE